MKYAIDVREALSAHRTGKGHWSHMLTRELLSRGERLLCYTDVPLPDEWKLLGAEETLISLRGMRWHMRVAAHVQKRTDVAAYISPTSYLVPYLVGRRLPCVPVVHDLIAFRHEPHDRKAQFIERLTLRRVALHAAHILTVSESTKTDLLNHFRFLGTSRVTPVFAGPMRADPPPRRSDNRTIFCIATLCPRKNQERLIRAFASLPDDLRGSHRLVLAGGRGWHDDSIIRLIHKTPGVEWLDYVSDEQYDHLLSTCAVFAFPSLYEGFGMPVLDALQYGVPVLTSDRGSLREVAHDAALVVDPEDVSSIRDGLQRLLTDSSLRERLSLAGPDQAATFSWERTADLVLDALEGIIGRSTKH